MAERAVLPSVREVELGVEVPAHAPATPEQPPAARIGRRARIRASLYGSLREADPRAIEGPTLPLLILAATALLGSWDNTALGLFFPEIRREFGLSVGFLLTIGTVTGIAFQLLGPAFGYLADRFSRVWLVRIGGLIGNGASIAQGLAPGVGALVGAQVVQGVGGAVAGPASGPLLADYYPVRSRARVYSLLGIAGGVGTIAATLLAGNLGEVFGWRPTVVALGVLATLVSLGAFWLREPPRGYHDRIALGASEEVARREQAPVTWGEAWRAAGAITTVRRLWYATPFLTVGSTGISTILLLYYAQEFDLGPRARSTIGVVGIAVGLLGLLVGAPLADKFLQRKPARVIHVLAGLSVLSALNVLILAVSNNLYLSVVVGLPINFLGAMATPALLTLFSLTIPARLRGLGLQTFAPWAILGRLFTPFIGGFIDSHSLRAGLALFSPLSLIGAAIIWSTAFGLDRDIRNALAASMADEEAARARAAGQGKIVVCRDLDVHYDGVQVLFNVDCDVYEGEILALLGTNGAGKSTLLRALSGLSDPTAGAVVIDGRDTTHLPPHELAALGVAQMPGGRGVFPALSVADNLRAAAWLSEREDIEAEVERLTTEMFPTLGARLDQPAGALSGGEQQMLSLAQAFLQRPRLLFIDELSLGLAPAVVEELLAALRAMREQGTSIVVVDQSVDLALRFADRVVFMEKGEVRFTGSATELLERRDLLRSVYLRGPGAGDAHRAVSRSRAPAERAGSPVLEVRDVAVAFGGVQALRGASLEVYPEEIVGIIGANGAGKTTLFDVVSGFVAPDRGHVLLGGRDVTVAGPDERARAGLGRSFQDSRLFPAMTVRDNVLVALERHLQVRSATMAAAWLPAARRSEARAHRRAEALIEMLGIGDYRDRLVGELSTGVRRLTDIAVQLAANPDVLLLDEPSSGVAQAETVELAALLRRVRREAQCALLVIEHDTALISGISDRLVAMSLGVVEVSGEPDDVLADERVVNAYLGSAQSTDDRKDPR